MSFGHWVDVVVGVQVKLDALFEYQPQSGCSHSGIPTTAKFCPECGAQVTTHVKLPVPGFDGESAYMGLDVVYVGYDRKKVVVGKVVAHLSPVLERFMAEVDPLEVAAAKEAVSSLLAASLFRDTPIGMWACLSGG